MAQPPSLLWNLEVQTNGNLVTPIDPESQGQQAQVKLSGTTQVKPWSELSSDLCVTRNDPCVPYAPTPSGSYS